MMHPNPFNDDLQESGIPMFGKNGTALSQEERAAIARRRGLCLKCGTKTHVVKVLGRTPLTNDDVYQGTCIKCNPNAVPAAVLADWHSRNAQVAAVQPANSRFKAASTAVRFTAGGSSHRAGPPPGAPGSSIRRPPGGPPMMGAEGGPSQSLNRKDSRTPVPLDPYQRGSSHGENGPGNLHRKRSVGPQAPGRSMSGGPSYGLDSEDYKGNSGLDAASLLRDMKDNKDKPEILRTKLHALRNLGDDPDGALAEIKEVLETYKHDPRLLTVSVGAIWSIASRSDENKAEAVKNGCLELMIEMIRHGRAKDDAEAVQWTLGAITAVARLDESKRQILAKGGVEGMLEAMKRHENHPGVFEWGCRALYTFVSPYQGDGSVKYDQEIAKIEDYGGITVIIGCMKLQVNESGALWWALKLLLAMQVRTDPGSMERSVGLIKEEELPSILVNVVNGRAPSPEVVVQCEYMFLYLMSFAVNRLLQQEASECIPGVVRALSENPQHAELQDASAQFLAAVARDNLQSKRQIIEGNILRLLVRSMTASVATLLWVLSQDESSFDYSILGETKLACEAAAKARPDDRELLAAICGYVANTAAHGQGRADCIPVDLVLQLVTTGGGGSQGGKALAAVCSAFPDVAERIVQGGTCDQMLEGLCSGEVEVQTSSAAALSAIIAASDNARTKVFAAGGLGTASAALFATTSEELARNLLLLVNSVVSGGSKKALQLPNELVLAILQAVTSFPGLTKLACTTIRNAMLITVPGFKSVSTDGLVELLTDIIDNPTSPNDLVIEACGAIWAYTAKQPLANANVSSQIFRSVLGLCARNKGENGPFNGPVLTEAAGALAAVMHCVRENPVHIPDTDIDLIISLLDVVIECDVENVPLMDGLMDVILTLCFLSKEILIQFGVIVVVIDCMVEHEGNEVIQQKGCAILALLASTENLQVNLSIAETDGIDMIVSALAGFTENVLIQTDACRALSHLSIDHESRMLISSQGGLILLVNAMNRFRDDVDLLEACCSALLNLSSDAEEQVLAGSSVVETVVATMRHQLTSPRLQEKCLGVLQNVSMRSKESKRAIADAGGIGAVTFAIKEFMGAPSVLERSFTTMWSLAVLEENQDLIANEGGISLVINGMMANITYEKVQKQACGCLCTLSSNSRNKTLIRDLGGVDAIVYAMWAHYNSDGLLIEACRALSSLAVNVQTNEVMIASDGEISAIMSAMRRFPLSERLQEHACVALRNFLLSADNAAIVRPQAHELEQLMNAASSRFPAKCAERAKQVMASLR